MKASWLALLLAFVALAAPVKAEWDAYHEVANITKNWSTTNQNPWLMQGFSTLTALYYNMTQDCTGLTDETKITQCWTISGMGGLRQSLWNAAPNALRNVTLAPGSSGDTTANVTENSFTYVVTGVAGNYTLNGTFYGFSGYDTSPDKMNYSVYLNKTGAPICAEDFDSNASLPRPFNCSLGSNIPNGTQITVRFGANGGIDNDYGNTTFSIYGNVLYPNVTTVSTCQILPDSYTTYQLNQNLSLGAFGWACLNATDIHDIVIDCKGYNITGGATSNSKAVETIRVDNFTLQGCGLNTGTYNFRISGGHNLMFQNNTFTQSGSSSVRNLFINTNTTGYGNVSFLNNRFAMGTGNSGENVEFENSNRSGTLGTLFAGNNFSALGTGTSSNNILIDDNNTRFINNSFYRNYFRNGSLFSEGNWTVQMANTSDCSAAKPCYLYFLNNTNLNFSNVQSTASANVVNDIYNYANITVRHLDNSVNPDALLNISHSNGTTLFHDLHTDALGEINNVILRTWNGSGLANVSYNPYNFTAYNLTLVNWTNAGLESTFTVLLYLNTTVPPDLTAPMIAYAAPTPLNATLWPNDTIMFNATYNETNPGITILEWNNSANYTMTCTVVICFYNLSGIPNGNYTYFFWANDTSGNVNVTTLRQVQVDGPNGTFYIMPSGDDANSGTLNLPWRTINKAVITLRANQTAYVFPGTYNISNGSGLALTNIGTSTNPKNVNLVSPAFAGNATSQIKIIGYSNTSLIGLGNSAGAQNDSTMVFVTGGGINLNRSFWTVQGFYFKEKSVLRVRTANNEQIISNFYYVDPFPDNNMTFNGSYAMSIQTSNNTNVSGNEMWSICFDCYREMSPGADPDETTGNLLGASTAHNLTIERNYIYAGRDNYAFGPSVEGVTIKYNYLMFGQEHIQTMVGLDNWTFNNNVAYSKTDLVTSGGGQSALYTSSQCDIPLNVTTLNMTNGQQFNNLAVGLSMGTYRSIDSTTPCPSYISGFYNVSVKNNIAVRLSISDSCYSINAGVINALDSNYNLCVGKNTSSNNNWMGIYDTPVNYNLSNWTTQNLYPQITQDPNSSVYGPLNGGNPTVLGYGTNLPEIGNVENDHVDCGAIFGSNYTGIHGNCAYPYRMKILDDLRNIYSSSIIRDAGDPSFGSSYPGGRIDVGPFEFDDGGLNVTLVAPANGTVSSSLQQNFSYTVVDDLGVSICSLWTNRTGVWLNTSSNATAIPNNTLTYINYTFPLPGYFVWNVLCTDINGTSLFSAQNYSLRILDAVAPQWSLNQTNTTIAGNLTRFSVFWTDTVALNNFTFSHDNGNGTFYNETVQSMTGTANWSNFSYTTNVTNNSLIRWRVYAWDSSSTMNVTSIFSFNALLNSTPGPLTRGTGILNYSVWDDFVAQDSAFHDTNSTTKLGKFSFGTYNGTPTVGFNDLGSGSCTISKTATYGRVTSSTNGNSCTAVWISNSYGIITVSGNLTSTSGNLVLLQKWTPSGVTTLVSTVGTASFNNLTTISPGDVFRIYSANAGVSNGFNADNVTFNGSPGYGYVFILAKDEQTLALKTFNVTMDNSTNFTAYNSSGFASLGLFRNLTELPSGVTTMTFRNPSCQTGNIIPRSYSINLTLGQPYTAFNFTAYLLCDSSTPIIQTFLPVDSLSGASLDGVAVAAQRDFGSGLVNVSSGVSSGGSVSFYMDFSTTYTITADLTGYQHFSSTWQPSTTTTNRILMVSLNQTIFNYSFANITFSYGPPYTILGRNVIWFNISSSDGQLTQYGMDLIGHNATFNGYINQTSDTNPFGGNVSVDSDFSLGNYTNVTAVFWWIKAGFSRQNATITYYPFNATNQDSSLTGAIDAFNQNPPSNTLTGFIAILITAPFAAWVSRYGGPAAGGIAAIGMLGFFAFFANWLPWTAWAVITLFVITAIYFVRGKG